MNSNIKTASVATLATILFLTTPPLTHAQGIVPQWVATNPSCIYKDTDGDQIATIQGLECVVTNILNVAITLIGIAILVMFALGSFKILTSGGDPKNVAAGKQTLTYAVLGLVLAILAWFIINLIAQFTGATGILQFNTQI